MTINYDQTYDYDQLDRYTCEECSLKVDTYCQGYMDVAGVTVCENCVNRLADEDGSIEFKREGELVTFELTFDDGVFSETCRGDDIFCREMIKAGYVPVRSSSNTFTVTYEPPVMRKLRGLANVEDVIISVNSRIYEILTF